MVLMALNLMVQTHVFILMVEDLKKTYLEFIKLDFIQNLLQIIS